MKIDIFKNMGTCPWTSPFTRACPETNYIIELVHGQIHIQELVRVRIRIQELVYGQIHKSTRTCPHTLAAESERG